MWVAFQSATGPSHPTRNTSSDQHRREYFQGPLLVGPVSCPGDIGSSGLVRVAQTADSDSCLALE